MNIIKKISIILTSLLISIGAAHAETWNMALAYGAGTFHSQNATAFAEAVRKGGDPKGPAIWGWARGLSACW